MLLIIKKDFKNTPEYLDTLIKRAKINIEFSEKSLSELQVEVGIELSKMGEEPDYVLLQNINDILQIILGNENLKNIINEPYYKIENAIEFKLLNSDYDLELPDTDKKEIVKEVLMSFI